MEFLGVSLILVSAAIFWLGLTYWLRTGSGNTRLVPVTPDIVGDRELRGGMERLRSELPDLPPLPGQFPAYEGWFVEVEKRIAARSQQRTMIETRKLLEEYTALHAQWLKLRETQAELRRLATAGTVKDATLEAEKAEAQLRTAKAKKQIDELNAPAPKELPSQRETALEAGLRHMRSQAKELHEAAAMREALLKEFPDQAQDIEDAYEEVRIRIKERRR